MYKLDVLPSWRLLVQTNKYFPLSSPTVHCSGFAFLIIQVMADTPTKYIMEGNALGNTPATW